MAYNNLSQGQINAATSIELLGRMESCLEYQCGNFIR